MCVHGGMGEGVRDVRPGAAENTSHRDLELEERSVVDAEIVVHHAEQLALHLIEILKRVDVARGVHPVPVRKGVVHDQLRGDQGCGDEQPVARRAPGVRQAGLQTFEEEERGENRRLRESGTADDFGDEQLKRKEAAVWRQLRTLKQVGDEVLAERGDLLLAKVGVLGK